MRATSQNKASLSRQEKAGKAFRVAPSIYIVGSTLPREAVVRHHLYAIIAAVWPGSVLCDRTALAGGALQDGWVFIAHPEPNRADDLRLPGITISVRIGPGPLPGDMEMPDGLFLSGTARRLVENITAPGRPPKRRQPRQAGTQKVEDEIDNLARRGGSGTIQNVLRELDAVAGSLPEISVNEVRVRLVAVLGTFNGVSPSSSRLAARLAREPFDEHRIEMFRDLAELLLETAPVPRPTLGDISRWTWEPFFEAYFSNFIEGTEFGVDEARKIAIEGFIPAARPKDAHDIEATYRIISDPQTRSMTPSTSDELIDMLRQHHGALMASRPESHPGMFKERTNYAGGYEFVGPDLVIGTLRRGFEAFSSVTDPLQRAVALMLLITECHPFDDGNGRVARIMANGALSAAGQIRIVIPTIYRNNYLAGLAGTSNRNGKGETLIAVLQFAQRWTGAVNWRTYEAANETLVRLSAYLDPGLAEASGIRLQMP